MERGRSPGFKGGWQGVTSYPTPGVAAPDESREDAIKRIGKQCVTRDSGAYYPMVPYNINDLSFPPPVLSLHGLGHLYIRLTSHRGTT